MNIFIWHRVYSDYSGRMTQMANHIRTFEFWESVNSLTLEGE